MSEDEEVQQVKEFLEKHRTTKDAFDDLSDAWQKFKKVFLREFPLCKLARKINTLLGIKNKNV